MAFSESDLGYAAAAIDGEGCIHIRSTARRDRKSGHYWNVAINVTNSDPRLPLRLQKVFGVGAVNVSRDADLTRRTLYEWTVVTKQAITVLRAVLPFLVIKREQAEIAIAFAETMRKTGQWLPLDAGTFARRSALKEQLTIVKAFRPTLKEVS